MSKEFYRCPKCKSESITGEQEEYDEDVMWRFTYCEDCGYRWMETYEFSANYDVNGIEIDENGNPVQP